MRKLAFIAFSVLMAHCAQAQNRFGVEIGATTNFWTMGGENKTYAHSSDAKPMVSLNYLRKLDRHVYLGAKLSLESYAFYYSVTDNTKNLRADVNHNSSYLFVAPMVDIGLGHSQLIHLYFSLPLGFNTSADESSKIFDQGSNTAYNFINTTSNVNKFVMRPTIGLKQHIPLMKNWHFTLNEGIGFMATDLTTASKITNVNPSYLTIQMGLMRKFHRPKHG